MPTALDQYFSVTSVRIIEAYTIHLTFDDGTERTIDLEGVLFGPVFSPLQDKTLFAQVRVNPDTGTIEWPTGADFNPVVLHDWPEYETRLKDSLRQSSGVAE